MSQAIAEALCRAGRELAGLGLIAGPAGNLSARVGPDRLLITPRGAHKGRLDPADLVSVPLDESVDARLDSEASTELPFHRACYAADAGVGAVVHTHAPALVAGGLRGLDLAGELPEIELAVGRIEALPFAASGSAELGEAVGGAVGRGALMVLLERHGVVTVGHDVDEAVQRTELAELAAYTVLLGSAQMEGLDLWRAQALRTHLEPKPHS